MPGSPAYELSDLAPSQLDKFIETYAIQAIKISGLSFGAIGGLRTDETGAVVVGSMADVRNSNGPDCDGLGGPFSSTWDKYSYLVEAALAAIKAGQLFRKAPLRAYLAHLEVRALINSCPLLKKKETHFYLKHPDAKSDNILIAEDGSVTALLDWDW
jgi:hypothetical protein